jgi:catechol 2,3-dioxygenase-like lactoylglutathione lyase family enzyme
VTLELPFCCAAAGFERDVGLERAVDFELVAFDRAVGLDCVAAFARALGFERDDGFAERLEVAFAFGAEPFDDPLPDLLRGLLEAGLLFAILIPLLDSGTRLPSRGYPVSSGLTQGIASVAAISNQEETMISSLDFVGIPSQDAERSRSFYIDTLGLKPDEHGRFEFWVGETCFGIWEPEKMGMPFEPQRNAHPALHVDDVAATRAELEAKGVEFTADTFDTGVCHMALFRDPDGNDLMLHNRYAPYAD